MMLRQKDEIYYTENGDFFGEFYGDWGPHGNSTGEFKKCETTAPFTELGITHINGVPVKKWE